MRKLARDKSRLRLRVYEREQIERGVLGYREIVMFAVLCDPPDTRAGLAFKPGF